MFSSEIKWCYFSFGCVFCVLHFVDLLTGYTVFACVVASSVVHYYLYKRNENFRHRLSVLGLVKRDKTERKVNSRACENCVHTNSWKGDAKWSTRSAFTSPGPGHINVADNFVSHRSSLSASSSPQISAHASALSFANKSTVERQHKHTFCSGSPRKSSLDWEPAFHKRYPVQQEKYAVGKYPSVCLAKSPLPTAKLFGAQDSTASVKVKILPLASSPKQHTISPQAVESNEASKQDPCSTEAVLKALKERRKRAAVPGQDDLDKGESSKRQRRELPVPSTPVHPSPPFCPAPMASFSGTVHNRTSEKRPFNSEHNSSGDGPKRIRSNAIFSSFCSSRSLIEGTHTHKRKASVCETPQQMKITKEEDRSLAINAGSHDAADHGAETVIEERSTTPSVPVQNAEEITAPHCDASKSNATSPKREFLPSDQSVRKKKLVFPEHMATMQEHEQDRLLERQRLDLMLGSVKDLYQGSKPVVTLAPQGEKAAATQTSLKACTSTAPTPVTLQTSTTNVAPTILSASVTGASKTVPAVTLASIPINGTADSQQTAKAQLPLLSTSMPCPTVPKMSQSATATPSFVGGITQQTPTLSSKTEAVAMSTLPSSTFVASPASGAIHQCATTAITHSNPPLPGLPPASATVTLDTPSSRAGPLPSIAGLPLPAASFPTTTAPLKTPDTLIGSTGEVPKSTPFVFGSSSTPVSTPLFTFAAQPATTSHSQPAAAFAFGTQSFCATQATNTTTASQGFAFNALSRTAQPLAVSSSTVNSDMKAPSQPMFAQSSFPTPNSPVFAISQTSTLPTSVPSTTQGGFKLTPSTVGGFSFSATPVPSQPSLSVVTNGVNGIGSHSTTTAPVFKFGSGNAGGATPSATFNFSAQQNSTPFASKPNFSLGSAPSLTPVGGPVANNSLFSIGSAARSDRPMATPRSRRSLRK